MLHRLDGESLSSIAREIPTAFEPMIQMCGKLRRECDKSPFITARDNWVRTLRELETELTRPHTLCRVMFCLPLTYGNTLTTFKSYRQGRETLIGSGNFKIANTYETYSAHFEWFFLLPADFDADTLRIEAEGFTGTGISFVTFTTPDAELTVDGIRSISGEVANPQHLLSETDTFCYFGSQDGFHATVDRKAGEIVHCVELSLRKTSRRKQKDE